jgi:hypothetical protein
MGTRLATASRNAACDAVVDLLDGGSGAGTIKVYTGTQPSTPNDAATGTLLVTVNLADPATGAASSGVATLAGTPLSGSGVATGTAGWARFADSAAAAVFDGVVTATGGGGQIELSTTSISTGVTVQITSGTVTMPLGS